MNYNKTLHTTLLSILTIVVCSFFAIIFHAILPVKVDISHLDSTLIKNFGFPCVGLFYFLILYTHCFVTVNIFKKYFRNNGLKSGVYFGCILSLLYMIGMQEIMLSVSPFKTWGIEFVIYQFFMGLGDVIPVIILCSIAGKLVGNSSEKTGSCTVNKTTTILLFTIIIGSTRTTLSQTNVIKNYMDSYFLPVFFWNYAFGFIIGVAYLILIKNFKEPEKWMIWGLIINWIIFNSFIGLIKNGAFFDALLRSILDGIVISGIVWLRRISLSRSSSK